MENVTDALKMAGAALLFILAFSVTMVMFSQARQTTDAIIGRINLTEYLPKIEGIKENNETRIVGIETVIPTLYRYPQSDGTVQIRIVDSEGTELQVFDVGIESQVSTMTLDKNANNYAYLKHLNDSYNNDKLPAYMFGAPWNSQGSTYLMERINAYIFGKKMEHFTEVDYSSTTGNNNYLMKYAKKRFKESYLEYRTGGNVSVDEYGEEVVTLQPSTKIIITYTIMQEQNN